MDLTNESVRQISFEVTANLGEVLSIFDGDQQQKAWLLDVLCAQAPTTRDREGIIENVLTVGAVYRDNRKLYLLLLVELRQRRFQLLFGVCVDNLRKIIDVTRRRRQRRLRRLRRRVRAGEYNDRRRDENQEPAIDANGSDG